MTIDSDLAIIDDLGVQAVADALEISREAVRKWRIKGAVPDHRRQELSNLVGQANNSCDDGQPGWPTSPAWLPMVVDQAPTVQSRQLVDVDAIDGPNAESKVEVAIAERDARIAGQQALAHSVAENGMPLESTLRGYGFRLAGLFALDFPVLTMAFVAVAKVSPIMAAGSAIALSLFLVLGAHLLGGVLGAAASSIPLWCRHMTAAVVLIGLLAAIVAVTVDLRLKGLELEAATSATSDRLVFGPASNPDVDLPPAFKLAIGQAAALVTIGSLLFGIAWSYWQHGPASARMKTERAYRRHLRRLARKRVKLARLERRAKKVGAMAAIAIAAATSGVRPGEAADCERQAVLALIDTTTAYDDVDRAVIMPAIERMAASLQPGQRLVLRTVRDAPEASRLLLDVCVPPTPEMSWTIAGLWSWLTTNPSTMVAERETFFADVRDALLPQLRSHGEASRTALVDTLGQWADDTEGVATIWLFSDLLESVVVSADDLLQGETDVLNRFRGRLAALDQIDVHVAGFGRFHDPGRRPLSADERASLIDNWARFFQQSGGRLHVAQASDTGVAGNPASPKGSG